MRNFTVEGIDEITQKRGTLTMQAPTVQAAAAFAATRQVKPEIVIDDDGGRWRMIGDAWTPSKTSGESVVPVVLLSLIVPVVGVLIGCIRLGTQRAGGWECLLAAFAGVAGYVILMLINGPRP